MSRQSFKNVRTFQPMIWAVTAKAACSIGSFTRRLRIYRGPYLQLGVEK